MKIKNIFIFGVGVAIGVAVTYKILTDKYEALINEEIESVKESLGYYRKKESDDVELKDIDKCGKDKVVPQVYDPLKSEKKDYENMIAYYKYHKPEKEESDDSEDETEEKDDNPLEFHKIESRTEHSFKDNIYVIPPNEYGAITDYDLIDLTLYNDGVLCDDMDEIVQDIDTKVGNDYKNHFGKFDEDEVIHVRNDILKCDYEITKDIRDYATVVLGKPPHYFN